MEEKELTELPIASGEKSRDVLDEFLWNIKTCEYKKVVEGMTKTFKGDHSKIVLLDWAEQCIPFPLKSYKIIERVKRPDGIDSKVFHTYRVELTDQSDIEFISLPNVVCEEKAYKASVSGVWGVNPVSIIPKGMYEKRKKDAKNK